MTAGMVDVNVCRQDNIPTALTRDKKRIKKQEVAVHLGWKSTLYVTNFPEGTDDAAIRDLFGQVRCYLLRIAFWTDPSIQFGVLFDVRWPSKKFKNSRRFCYVQYLSPVRFFAVLCALPHYLTCNLGVGSSGT